MPSIRAIRLRLAQQPRHNIIGAHHFQLASRISVAQLPGHLVGRLLDRRHRPPPPHGPGRARPGRGQHRRPAGPHRAGPRHRHNRPALQADKLSSGNVSGKLLAADNITTLANIAVTAIRTNDSSTVVSTVTRKDGSYELNLNLTFDWTIVALKPDDLATGQILIPAGVTPNSILTDQNIVLKA